MAGQPKRRAMLAELERRTRELFEGDRSKTHLDYAIDWLEGGKTMLELHREIEEQCKLGLSRGSLNRYFNDFEPNAPTKLAEARARGAYSIVDDTIEIADERVLTSEDVGRARNRIAARQWTAERFNRAALGQQRQGVQVNVSVGGLHLEALRVRATVSESESMPARESNIPQGGILDDPSAIAGAIASEAEIVSIEPASS